MSTAIDFLFTQNRQIPIERDPFLQIFWTKIDCALCNQSFTCLFTYRSRHNYESKFLSTMKYRTTSFRALSSYSATLRLVRPPKIKNCVIVRPHYALKQIKIKSMMFFIVLHLKPIPLLYKIQFFIYINFRYPNS